VQAAQRVLDDYKRSIEQPLAPRRDLHAHFAERINYCRQFDQTKMPNWKNPRS